MNLVDLERDIINWINFTEEIAGKVIDFLDRLVIKVASKIGPWLAPIVPAYFIYKSLVNSLEADQYIAVTAAFAIEAIGVSTMNVALHCYNWNNKKRKTDPEAPLKLAIGVVISYIVIGLVLVVGLEVAPILAPIALAGLVLLTVVGSITLAINTDLTTWENGVGLEIGLNKNKANKLEVLKGIENKIINAKNTLKLTEGKLNEYTNSLEELKVKKVVLEAKVKQQLKSKPAIKSQNKKSGNRKGIVERRIIVEGYIKAGKTHDEIVPLMPNISRSTVYNDIKAIQKSKNGHN